MNLLSSGVGWNLVPTIPDRVGVQDGNGAVGGNLSASIQLEAALQNDGVFGGWPPLLVADLTIGAREENMGAIGMAFETCETLGQLRQGKHSLPGV